VKPPSPLSTKEAFASARAVWADLQARGVVLGSPMMMATQRPPKDITARSSSMPRDSAILYKNSDPKGSDPAAYRGLLKMADAKVYWVGAWPRTVKGRTVIELRLVERKETTP
jgi:hypothetical protein